MHPVLIELGPFKLYSFGVFIAAAFLAGMAWTMREARLRGLDSGIVPGIGFHVLVGGLLGSRVLYVVLNPDFMTQDYLALVKVWKGGFVFLGGALAAALFMIINLYLKKQKVLPWLDSAAPGIALGVFLGWLGCLAAGCGYGRPSDLAWSIMLTHPDAMGPLFSRLHPAQAYHALAGLACFIVLVLIKNYFRAAGKLAGVFIVMYSLLRMLADMWRGDIDPAFMNVNQALGLAVAAAGLLLLYQPFGTGKTKQ